LMGCTSQPSREAKPTSLLIPIVRSTSIRGIPLLKQSQR
jgi:hypothetical protein